MFDTHGVGPMTGTITSPPTILSSSCLTMSRCTTGNFLGGLTTGLTSLFKSIVYAVGRVPSPSKTSVKSLNTLSFSALAVEPEPFLFVAEFMVGLGIPLA